MASLFTFSITGIGFLLIATIESLSLSLTKPFLFPSLHFISTSILSSLIIISSLISSISSSKDPIGLPLPFSTLLTSSLFLLYSISGLLSLFPSSLLNLISLFAFLQEFLLFYLRRKDLSGLENHYFDLLLFPIFVCIISAILILARPHSPFPRLARAVGLALQGMWLLQIGFSFFSTVMAHGCHLHEKSKGNYTISCKGHPEYHRGRAIATLQFNCHLAFLVVLGLGIYSVYNAQRRHVGGGPRYRPLNKELQRMDHVGSQFTLDSDDDDEGEEIVEDANRSKQHEVVAVNGFGGSH